LLHFSRFALLFHSFLSVRVLDFFQKHFKNSTTYGTFAQNTKSSLFGGGSLFGGLTGAARKKKSDEIFEKKMSKMTLFFLLSERSGVAAPKDLRSPHF
jgi:hypothetical protein